MKTLYIRIFSVVILIALAIVSVTAGVTAAPATAPLAATVSYTPDFATVFPNPERGFHDRYEILADPNVNPYVNVTPATQITGFPPDVFDRTFARAKQRGDTLVHGYIHMDYYQTSDLPQALLDDLSAALAAARAAGVKWVIRGAYVWAGSPNVTEAQMLRHMDQLNPILTANADVVNHIEMGYLGAWAEWHSGPFTGPSSREDADVRYRLIKHMLDTLPVTIPVAIRYPIFIKEFLELPTPSGSSPLTQTDKDRIGFHNDCFLADSADQGTYDNPSWMGYFDIPTKRQWMYDMITSYGGNKFMGGETCDSSGDDDAAGVNVQNYMTLLNTSELNQDYAKVNTDLWKAANLAASGNDPAETAFVRLQRKMGYRLRLVDATFPTSATAGNSFTFSANLNNDGYSSIIKPRPIYLVFDNGTSRFNVQMSSVDVRKWISGANNLAQQTVTLPSNMPGGTYKLALWLPDYYASIQSRPEYSIRLANTGTWDSTNGYNVLSNAINIAPSCTSNCPTNTPGPSPTNTPVPSATLTKTNTPAFSPLMIDSFSDATKWGTNHLNDLNKSISWAIASAYYNNATPGDIVLNSSVAGEYYQETITQNLAGVNLVLRLRDWGDNGTETHWNVILNDGTDHTLVLSTYATNITGTYADFNIPLSAFGANLANTQYIRIVHKDTTYAVLLVDTISIDGGAGPTSTPGSTNTPLPPTNSPTGTMTPTKTNTPFPPTNTPTKTSTQTGPTNTPLPPTATATRTNTPVGPTVTPTKTNTPLPPTATPTAGAALVIDSFPDANKWSSQHLNDLNKAVSWVMDSIYYGSANPGEIVMNSSPAGQYYQETITQTLAGRTNLVLRLRDWSDTDTENHWNIVLNDGTDHTVSLNTYGNVTGAYTNINIPLSAFGANLTNVQYVRLVHKDATYAVIMIDTLSAQ